eukprot:Partr_v1_DN26526_c1_g1_i5_m3992 putative Bromodomain-containing protein
MSDPAPVPQFQGKLKLSLKIPPSASSSSQSVDHIVGTTDESLSVAVLPKVKLKFKLAAPSSSSSSASLLNLPPAQQNDDELIEVDVDDYDNDKGGNGGITGAIFNGGGGGASDFADAMDDDGMSNASHSVVESNVTAPTQRPLDRDAKKLRRKALYSVMEPLLNSIAKKDAYGFFLEPVDTKLVPDYLQVIKQPMDFSTIRRRILQKRYYTFDEFKLDLRLIFENAKKYNAPGTIYHKSADKIKEYADKAIQKLEASTNIVNLQRPSATLNVQQQAMNNKRPRHTTATSTHLKNKKRRKPGKYLCVDGSREVDNVNDIYPHMMPRLLFPFDHACKSYRKLQMDAPPDAVRELPRRYVDYGPFGATDTFNPRLDHPRLAEREISVDLKMKPSYYA